MGCDIHIFIEYRKSNQNWSSDGEYDYRRNYYTFALMADVRNNGMVKPISKPRGLPEDVNEKTNHGLSSYHSLSWLTFEEFENIESELWCCYDESLVHKKAKDLIEKDFEARIVFGFDN